MIDFMISLVPPQLRVTRASAYRRDGERGQHVGRQVDRVRWMAAYCPCGDELVPGLPDAEGRRLDVPALAPALQAWADETARHQTSGRS